MILIVVSNIADWASLRGVKVLKQRKIIISKLP